MKKQAAIVVVAFFIVGMLMSVSMDQGSHQETEGIAFMEDLSQNMFDFAYKFFPCSNPAKEALWSYASSYRTISCNGNNYLGPFGKNGAVTSPTFNIIANHRGILVSAKVAFIDSWTGESFKILADGNIVYSTTWAHRVNATSNTCQSDLWKDGYVDVTFGFNHSDPELTFVINSTLDQASSNEAWGICDFAVVATSYLVTSEGVPIIDNPLACTSTATATILETTTETATTTSVATTTETATETATTTETATETATTTETSTATQISTTTATETKTTTATTTTTQFSTATSTTTATATATKTSTVTTTTTATVTVPPPPPPVAATSGWISVHDGYWGDWYDVFDDSGDPLKYYVYSFDIRSEPSQGGGDDTALNGLRVFRYSREGWSRGSWFDGNWGDWYNGALIASDLYQWYACGLAMRVEGSQGGGDDTAGNGIRVRYCSRISAVTEDKEFSGNWGVWSNMLTQWNPITNKFMRICALKVRSERPQGDGDDTALNGIQVRFCQE